MPTAPGTRIGPYEILTLLGAGGMGEVFKATDTRLGRTVAIKILKAEHTDRLDREARAIASLNHPHICTIHDIGPNYLVMEYLEGAPLSSPLPQADALRYAGEIAEALEAAHAKGIIHRDLKPGNIFITASGVKLLDFGLAKVHREIDSMDPTMSLTAAGTILGTAPYMSPEQAQAKPLDARSDIFSYGLVLYEMLSGQRAFAADSGIVILAAIVRDEPRPLKVSPDLDRIVMRCLRKTPADRFQTVTEIRAALASIGQSTAQQPSIAVLPFSNMSADKDNEYFSDGLAEEILNALGRVPGLKVTARTSSFILRGKELDARKIAEILNVQTVLEGSVRRSGTRIRVSVQLVNAADGYHLWSERYDRDLTDVFAVQDEIAAAIAAALKLKLVGEPARHTPNLPAYEAFLKGRYYSYKVTPEGWARSKEYFEQAIALDPKFAAPHAALAGQYLLQWQTGLRTIAEMIPLIRAEAGKAVDLADTSSHALLAMVAAGYEYDWKETKRQFQLALTPPAPAEVTATYAAFFLVPVGRYREAIDLMEKVVASDPLNIIFRFNLSVFLMAAGKYDRAIEEARKGLEIDESAWIALVPLVFSFFMKGMLAEALAAAERAHQLAPWHPRMIGQLAGILARMGDAKRAETLIQQLRDAPARPGAPIGMVLYHLIRAEIDAAADWYEKAIEQRDLILIPWITLPLAKPLRSSPRWPPIAKMMNLQQLYSEAGETS
jgi:TolB-like protein/Flp pilus assembly protein TadD/predicted Ser/Thr protein kinase